MAFLQRPPKQGNALSYQGKVALGFKTILASEADADFDTIYSAWNTGADTVNIADGAVTNPKLGPSAVDTRVLADGAVTAAKLDPNAQYWLKTGGVLKPADATTPVTLAVTSGNQLIAGTGTQKFHVTTDNTASSLAGIFSFNGNWPQQGQGSAIPDDATCAAWAIGFRSKADLFQVWRMPVGGGGWVSQMYLDASANLTIAGTTATKFTGTTWANPSDPRLKTDVASYTAGLDAVCALRPITFRYTGAAGTPRDAGPQIGFDAEAVRAVLPECVTTTRARLAPDDPESETDLLVFDMHPVLVALVNAVRELAARLPPP